MLQGHGDDLYKYKGKVKANFSSNVWSYPYIDELKEKIIAEIELITSYPEPEAESLRDAIAVSHSVFSGSVIVTNGATDAFRLIAQAYGNKNSLIPCPSFAEYEDVCRMFNHNVSFCQTDEWQCVNIKHDLVWLCNPNNPDGKAFSVSSLKEQLVKYPDAVFVLDEVYNDFSPEIDSAVSLLNDFENLIIVKSLTKLYEIPGLRLGYILAPESVVLKLKQYLQPWSVNSFAIVAGKFALENMPSKEDVQNHYSKVQALFQTLSGIDMLEVFPTKANFILCKLIVGTASGLKKFLLEEYGVLIRDASNFRSLSEQHFRVACLSKEKNQVLVDGIAKYISIAGNSAELIAQEDLMSVKG